MKKKRSDMTVCVLLNVIAVLTAAFLYLIYRNWLAEDMIRELNRDYEEMVKHYEGKGERKTGREEVGTKA